MAGKTGADAIFRGLGHICHTITRYRVKLDALIDAAVASSVISTAQAVTAHDFVASASSVCAIFEVLASFNSPF